MKDLEIFKNAPEGANEDELNAYLDKECQGDSALRERVDELFKAARVVDSEFLNEAPAGITTAFDEVTTSDSAVYESPGSIIGHYKLLEKLGEGGFGSVWAAEQREPVRRRVALKIIKLGMDTKQVVARFEAERQALAMMDHPNMAKVLDAGTTEQGRPFFVMELVKGVPITTYCDQEKLSVKDRLELFIKVCHAIQHAHQKGIIHRDIKPSNILVTLHDGVPVPKVIDFGIAKATQMELTEKTIYTQYSQFIGTPAYMSPEQAEMSGLDIDTRSDVYSLGVLLYELLTGSTPFDTKELQASGIDEMRKIIRERDPIKPSTRISQIQSQNLPNKKPVIQSTPLPSDLDWIVLKCLEKNRNRRYETSNRLAEDIRCHLEHHPITARPPSFLYQCEKNWQRNKLAWSSGVAIFLSLAVGIIVSSYQARIARNASNKAEEATIAEGKLRIEAEIEKARALKTEKEAQSLKEQAVQAEKMARLQAYAADMMQCKEAIESHNLRRARILLERYRPASGEVDLRGWEWRHLWQLCKGDQMESLPHFLDRASSVHFLENDRIAVFVDGGQISVWDGNEIEDGILIQPLSINRKTTNSNQLAITENRQWMAAEGRAADGSLVVRVWDTSTESKIREFKHENNGLQAMAISNDRKWLVSLFADSTILVWDLVENKLAKQLDTVNAQFPESGSLAISPDGKTLAIGRPRITGQAELTIELIELGSWEPKQTIRTQFIGRGILELTYSNDGSLLAAGAAFTDPRILIMDVKDNYSQKYFLDHQGFVPGLAFSPDDSLLASASADQSIKLWSTSDWTVEATLIGHADEVWSVSFSQDGKKIVSGSKDDTVKTWTTSSKSLDRESIMLPTGHRPGGSAPSNDKEMTWDPTRIHIWNKEYTRVIHYLDSNKDSFTGAAWMSKDEILIQEEHTPNLKIWNIEDRSIIEIPFNGEYDLLNYYPSQDQLWGFSRDNQNGSWSLKKWKARKGKLEFSYSLSNVEKIDDWAISNDGNWAVIAKGGIVEIRNISLEDSKEFQLKTSHTNIQGIEIYPEKSIVFTADTSEPTIHVWNYKTQELLATMEGHNLVIASLDMTMDGERLTSKSIGDEPVLIWDTRSWNQVAALKGRSGYFLGLQQLFYDGNTISASETKFGNSELQFRIWKAPSWQEIANQDPNEWRKN